MTGGEERAEMLMQLSLARQLIRAPSKLTGKELNRYGSIAESIGDRCYFNWGWYASSPDKVLRGSASTEKILFDLRTLITALRSQALPPKRKAGRPAGSYKAINDSYLPVITDHLFGPGKSLAQCVATAAKKGLIDPDTKDTAHIRRIQRYYDMLRKKFAEPEPAANVIKFPSRSRRTKPK